MNSAILERTASDVPALHDVSTAEDQYQVVLRMDPDDEAAPEVFALGSASLHQLSAELDELAGTYGGETVRHTWSAQPWCTDVVPSLAVQHTLQGLVLHVSVLRCGYPRRLKLALRADQVAHVLNDLRGRLHRLGSRTTCASWHTDLDVRQDACLAAMWLVG